jgi:2,4-dienoyl-CoA reductase-like NADH-dependent reductase (Old Yellow Enzyme family)
MEEDSKIHTPFRFKSLEEMNRLIAHFNLDLLLSDSFDILATPLKIGDLIIPNRLAIHPMEGCDGLKDGSPSALTERRYERFGRSGAGLIWYEATAIHMDKTDPLKNPRANPRQLMLTVENQAKFQKLIRLAEKEENKLVGQHPAFGKSVKILQLTHSGRYTRPGFSNPQRIYHYDPLDAAYGQTRNDGKILTDDELALLPDHFEKSVQLAKDCGFDGVDIKCCHRYLLSESLSSFTRINSIFGGETYEARTRLFKSIINKVIKYNSPTFLITTRFNLTDCIPYPYGWGVKKVQCPNSETYTNIDLPAEPDLSEPIRLLKELYELGIRCVNLTIANPYFNSFVSRPYDQPLPGAKLPPEHPLIGVSRFITLTRTVRAALPSDMIFIGTGYTWLRQFAPNVAAAEIANHRLDMVGFGRMSFANPEFGQQLFLQGGFDPKKVCITCSKCTELMRKKTVSGCVIRDAQTYLPYYKGEKQPQEIEN